MKIAHLAIIAPHLTGLYATARDIIKAERKLGHDARMVDPFEPKEGTVQGIPTAGHQWACGADLWISHSGEGKTLKPHCPMIHVLHGRPYSSFMLGVQGRTRVYAAVWHRAKTTEHKFVTFWQDYIPYWRHFISNGRLSYVPAPVDLDDWTPDGPRGYGFHGKQGAINIVIADQWRLDKNPHEVIHAFSLYAEKVKGAKLHLYGFPTKNKGALDILVPLHKRGCLGEVKPFVSGLANAYRAADAVITPHHIATRIVREALACGCQVVMGKNPTFESYSPYSAQPADVEGFAKQIDVAVGYAKTEPEKRRKANRAVAEKQFDPAVTAQGLVELRHA